MIKRNLCELKIEGNKDNTKVISIAAVSAVAIGAGCLMGSKAFATESRGNTPTVASFQTVDNGVLYESIGTENHNPNARGVDSVPNVSESTINTDSNGTSLNQESSDVLQKDSRITLTEILGSSSNEENIDKEPSWLDKTLELIFGESDETKKEFEIVEYSEIDPEKYRHLYVPKAKTADNSSESSNDSGETASDSNIEKKTREEFIKIAKSYLGKGIKYKMGAKNTKKLDCSGYVSLVLKDMGLKVNEFMINAYKYRKDSTKIERSDLKVGDLVFWHDLTGKRHSPVYHIGFYLGEDTVIDCSTDHGGMGTRKLSSLKDKKGDKYFTFGRYEKLEKVFEADN